MARRGYVPRHGAWVDKKRRQPARRSRTQLLPVAAALLSAAILVGSAGTAIGLSPTDAGYDVEHTVNQANVSLADPYAQASNSNRSNGLAPLTAAGSPVVAPAGPTVVASGTCDAVYYSKAARTASGEAFDPAALTTAHRSLPFGTLVRVTNQATGTSVTVRVNDRAQLSSGRCLNLSIGAFRAIADPRQGVVGVRYEVLAADAT